MHPGTGTVPWPRSDDWLALRDAVKRFEDAWRQGLRPAIDDYLPPDSPPRTQVLIELVHIDLELRLKAGEVARVEEYLTRYPKLAEDKHIALGLIAAEHELRRRQEPGLALDEYLRRFPQHRAELPEQLAQATIHVRPAPPRPPSLRAEPLPEIACYKVMEVVGRGGMGVVYRARQLALARTVALKMILSGSQAGPKELARFRAEAAALARLQHPNIVQIYDVGESEGRPYFVLEFVAGGSLAQHLRGAPQPARPAAQFIETLARAVHAAHASGVIHRDLKPGNILLAASPVSGGVVRGDWSDATIHHSPLTTHQPKITDFGLAKCADSDGEAPGLRGPTVTGELLGTPNYMAPEQAMVPRQRVGPPADVYALGAILYELLTGRPPLKGETALTTVLQVLHNDPVSVTGLQPNVPRDLETICHK